jgi:glycosyltransferase involved in cell wall biosynthesis
LLDIADGRDYEGTGAIDVLLREEPAGRAFRVCVVGKYPPIQGGVSAQSYWMCRWLAERGHQIDIVTNADEVEECCRLSPDELADGDDPADGRPGALRVWRTESPTPAYRHIPQTNPVVTKLTSLALEAIHAHNSELVVGFYLEPYAVAACLAAKLSRRPLLIRHAGSDVGRLLSVPQLGPAYRSILASADLVCARPAARRRFLELGVPASRLAADPGWAVPRECFHPAAEPLDINAHLATLGLEPIDPAHPVIGIYGKMGAVKGTFDLLDALCHLTRQGAWFTLLAPTHGSADDEARFARAVSAGGLSDRVRQIPFLPHRRVPAFLRACSLVCVLEREFPIASHYPGTAAEVLACGTPLVVSAEVARKQPFAARLVHGRNVLIVRDPRDHDELALVLRDALEDTAALRRLGTRGARAPSEIVSAAERIRPYEELFATAIDGTRSSVMSPGVEIRNGGRDDEEERMWLALQEAHPAIACIDVLDTLLYRDLATGGPDPASVPALAPNVVIRPFSRHMDADDPAPCAYAFQHLPYRDRTRTVWLGPGHHLLSSYVDGARSLRAIAAAIDPDSDGVVHRVCAAARELFDEGILVFSTPEGSASWPTSPTRNRHLTRQ